MTTFIDTILNSTLESFTDLVGEKNLSSSVKRSIYLLTEEMGRKIPVALSTELLEVIEECNFFSVVLWLYYPRHNVKIQITNNNNLLKTNFIYNCLTKTQQEIVKLNLKIYNISYIQ